VEEEEEVEEVKDTEDLRGWRLRAGVGDDGKMIFAVPSHRSQESRWQPMFGS